MEASIIVNHYNNSDNDNYLIIRDEQIFQIIYYLLSILYFLFLSKEYFHCSSLVTLFYVFSFTFLFIIFQNYGIESYEISFKEKVIDNIK